MNPNDKDNLTTELAAIQDRFALAYTSLHGLLQAEPERNPQKLDRLLELTEELAVRLRNLAESIRPPLDAARREAAFVDYSGRLEVTEQGWLHIELYSLLPTCRYKTPKLLVDTLSRLLKSHQAGGGQLPYFSQAMLVIDEHCDLKNRQVFDQDNKGWKAIPNALKGIVISDDDQFSLQISLLSTLSARPCCHIYLLPQNAADYFFSLRGSGGL